MAQTRPMDQAQQQANRIVAEETVEVKASAQQVYAAWNDGRWEPDADLCGSPGRHSDIAFSKTTDAVPIWTQPMRLNNYPISTGLDQIKPSLGLRWDVLLVAK